MPNLTNPTYFSNSETDRKPLILFMPSGNHLSTDSRVLSVGTAGAKVSFSEMVSLALPSTIDLSALNAASVCGFG
jgi:hypothetical protein